MDQQSIINVYYCQLEEPWPEDEFKRLLNLLPSSLHENVLQKKDPEIRQGILARKLLLMHGLREAGVKLEHPLAHVEYLPSGKPYLEGAPHFSLANDGRWAACCLSPSSVLGIDLERIKPINLSNYQSQMTYLEWREIYSHVIPLRRFYEFWTIKESVIKADGKREKTAVKDIFIRPDVAFCHARYWYIHPIELDYSYVCFLVCSEPHQEIVMHEVNLQSVF